MEEPQYITTKDITWNMREYVLLQLYIAILVTLNHPFMYENCMIEKIKEHSS
jgi:hypothetical protein